jgi:hypothetical protein
MIWCKISNQSITNIIACTLSPFAEQNLHS